MVIDSVANDAKPTNRRIDPETGYMYVTGNVFTKATVNEYYGKDIFNWRSLGLDPQKLYRVYRPAEEIANGIKTLIGCPFLSRHPEIDVDAGTYGELKDLVIGSIGTDITLNNMGEAIGMLVVHDQTAINEIVSYTRFRLSCGYLYKAIMEKGVFEGMEYDIRMTNLRFNHVALVQKGRVDEARVNDGFNVDVQNGEIKEKDMAEQVKSKAKDENTTEVITPSGDKIIIGAPGTTGTNAVTTHEPIKATVAADEMTLEQALARIAELESKLAEKSGASDKQDPAETGPNGQKTTDADPMSKEDQPSKASDSAIDKQKVYEEAWRYVSQQAKQRDKAIDAIRPLVGNIRASAHDSAYDVYAYALKQVGAKVPTGINAAGLEGMVNAFIAARQNTVETGLASAHDSIDDSGESESPFAKFRVAK